ncbi:MAG TPA: galactokinase [Candidatus Dormibacteraeota bacterium]|jgi:D-glycero-alpha-D-manno-heptose-7-phosphate kinase|nr:galactokinase [Candidatus Dormibacteraeota bacterium]
MIITRAPLRISLGGGGTDLPSYYLEHGGSVISAAIDKYVYIGINRTFTDDYFIKYSALERRRSVAEIDHPIVREALAMHEVGPAIELVSLADIPSGTGLGSSGTFTVGLLRALYAFKREHVSAHALAEEACHIEIERLGRPGGKQDQYIAAFGGITCFEFCPDGKVHVSPLLISQSTLHDLEEHLLLFFTGYSRDADHMLVDQKKRSEQGDKAMLDNLRTIAQIGGRVKQTLEAGDTRAFGRLMHEHWEHKKRRTEGMSTGDIDRWYDAAMDAGALGGKLVGAGAGGFLLFYAEQPARVREAMVREGLAEVRFQFDFDGASVITRS